MKLVRTRLARRDIIEIWRTIARDSPGAATRLLAKLDARCELLREYPELGPLRGGRRTDVRQLTEGEYLIFYRIAPDRIEILRVLHGRRDLSDW